MKKLNKNPLVSVIMPVYNAGSFLMPAIKSILNQTYTNFEFIIVNDCSTDNSWDIIQKYQKKYPHKIKSYSLKKTLNRGGDACANIALLKAKGKYIARMDADDIAYPKRLEKQVRFLINNSNIFLVGSSAYVIDKKGKIIGEKKEPTDSNEIYKAFFNYHPIIHPSVMFRKIVNKKRFSYNIKFQANNDYYTFFKYLCKGVRIANLPDKLIYYRIHGNNDTFHNMRNKLWNTIKIRWEMISSFQYEISRQQLFKFIIQILVGIFIPEKILTSLYFYFLGLKKVSLFGKQISFSPLLK